MAPPCWLECSGCSWHRTLATRSGVFGGGALQRRNSPRRDRCLGTCVRASRGRSSGGGLPGWETTTSFSAQTRGLRSGCRVALVGRVGVHSWVIGRRETADSCLPIQETDSTWRAPSTAFVSDGGRLAVVSGAGPSAGGYTSALPLGRVLGRGVDSAQQRLAALHSSSSSCHDFFQSRPHRGLICDEVGIAQDMISCRVSRWTLLGFAMG